MQSEQIQSIKQRVLKNKKQKLRLNRANEYLSEDQMKNKLRDIIYSKHAYQMIDILNHSLFNKHDIKQKPEVNNIIENKIKTMTKNKKYFDSRRIIQKIQDFHQTYFVPKIQTSNFKRSIDNVLQQKSKQKSFTEPSQSIYPTWNYLQSKIKAKKSFTEESSMYTRKVSFTNPSSPRNTKTNIKMSPQLQLKLKELPAIDPNYSRLSKNSKNNLRNKRQSHPAEVSSPTSNGYSSLKKRSNTYLFNIPSNTKKVSKSIHIIQQEKEYEWQQQLFENLSIMNRSNMKSKENLTIEKEKVSAFFKNVFGNEIITTYFKFDQFQKFSFMKRLVRQLMKIRDKELMLITFLTYDVNNDGFICEEDIYFFISKSNFQPRIIQDLNNITQFLIKNQVRSKETKLPERLFKLKQRAMFDSVNDGEQTTKNHHSNSKQFKSNPKNINLSNNKDILKKFFTTMDIKERSVIKNHQQNKPKKFMINFQVFCLIFAQRNPVLVDEIINTFILKLDTELLKELALKKLNFFQLSSAEHVFNEIKYQQWVGRLKNATEILQKGKKELSFLSQKY